MKHSPRPTAGQRGLSLIELIMFIVVVGAALAGVLKIFLQAGSTSADPQSQRQALAVAESLMEEVQLMPFTFCDPDDAQLETATSSAIGPTGCASLAESIGPESGETRYATPQFDNVNDYHGFAMNSGILDISGSAVPGLTNYAASVTVANAALGTITQASGDALLITVTVTGPGGTQVVLSGYRTRHSPNAAL
ncbi:type IV pilus modification PilV family protein [Roseateles koreensis]|uniref:Type II secretion system protein n=1 Tax=Roseateles koreensis TaxID=2987526 RepID=A0ABT5KNG1_9BURK|nr:type II secretion system protein [Roseateles koreensis]MDC8784454.1 type II secretion system protein [Roseateles koreensis]